MRRLFMAVLAGFVLVFAAVVRTQDRADDRLAFDVVSVKPNRTGETGLRLDLPSGRLIAVNIPLKQFIRAAYTLQLYQIEGAPRWVDTDRFDITAVAERGLEGPVVWAPGTHAPIQRMMQALLEDRFKMKARMEQRESAGYALEVRSPGATAGKLVPAASPCTATGGSSNGPGTLRWRCVPLAQFAELLSQLTGRFVADSSGLAGTFDLDLHWAPDSPGSTDAPSLFTALQEQLGLRLTPRRVRTPVLVIDAIEQPDAD